jgi:hypothetical protein
MGDDALVAEIREKARILYEGKLVPHRSCGMAIAETFDREPLPYHALRRGGLTGAGTCGAVLAGQLVLGELLAEPGSTAPASPRLLEAMKRYQAEVALRVAPGPGGTLICNDLTSPFPDFMGEPRKALCTGLSATVAEIVARIVVELGGPLQVTPIRK